MKYWVTRARGDICAGLIVYIQKLFGAYQNRFHMFAMLSKLQQFYILIKKSIWFTIFRNHVKSRPAEFHEKTVQIIYFCWPFAKKKGRKSEGKKGKRKTFRKREMRKDSRNFCCRINGKSSFVVIKVITRLSRPRTAVVDPAQLKLASHVPYVRPYIATIMPPRS